MSSQAEPEPTLIERLILSRNRERSMFLATVFGLTPTPAAETRDPPRDPGEEPSRSSESRDRVVLINAQTQGMVVIEGSPETLGSLLTDLLSKEGHLPASRASIEAMPIVKTEGDGDGDGGECAICLEEWEEGGWAREMPCKHRYHGECIEKWLGIHGSCPVCRYRMPVDDDGLGKSRVVRRDSREIWITFSFGRDE